MNEKLWSLKNDAKQFLKKKYIFFHMLSKEPKQLQCICYHTIQSTFIWCMISYLNITNFAKLGNFKFHKIFPFPFNEYNNQIFLFRYSKNNHFKLIPKQKIPNKSFIWFAIIDKVLNQLHCFKLWPIIYPSKCIYYGKDFS